MINKRQLGYHDALSGFPGTQPSANSFQEKPGVFESGEDYMTGYREGLEARSQSEQQRDSRQHILA